MKVWIKGKKWETVLLPAAEYHTLYGDDSEARCDSNKYSLVFNEAEFCKTTVIHEVTHAFIAACHLHSCQTLQISDFEEIVCELMENHIYDVIEVSDKVYNYGLKLCKI